MKKLFLSLLCSLAMGSMRAEDVPTSAQQEPTYLALLQKRIHSLMKKVIYRSTAWFKGDNFYPIEEGKMYRSAQLTKEGFLDYIQRYGLKTIINLRGPHSTLEEEEAAAREESKSPLLIATRQICQKILDSCNGWARSRSMSPGDVRI